MMQSTGATTVGSWNLNLSILLKPEVSSKERKVNGISVELVDDCMYHPKRGRERPRKKHARSTCVFFQRL